MADLSFLPSVKPTALWGFTESRWLPPTPTPVWHWGFIQECQHWRRVLGVHLVQPTHPAHIPEKHALLSMMEFPFPEQRYASDSGNLMHHVKHSHLQRWNSLPGLKVCGRLEMTTDFWTLVPLRKGMKIRYVSPPIYLGGLHDCPVDCDKVVICPSLAHALRDLLTKKMNHVRVVS